MNSTNHRNTTTQKTRQRQRKPVNTELKPITPEQIKSMKAETVASAIKKLNTTTGVNERCDIAYAINLDHISTDNRLYRGNHRKNMGAVSISSLTTEGLEVLANAMNTSNNQGPKNFYESFRNTAEGKAFTTMVENHPSVHPNLRARSIAYRVFFKLLHDKSLYAPNDTLRKFDDLTPTGKQQFLAELQEEFSRRVSNIRDKVNATTEETISDLPQKRRQPEDGNVPNMLAPHKENPFPEKPDNEEIFLEELEPKNSLDILPSYEQVSAPRQLKMPVWPGYDDPYQNFYLDPRKNSQYEQGKSTPVGVGLEDCLQSPQNPYIAEQRQAAQVVANTNAGQDIAYEDYFLNDLNQGNKGNGR